jgi:biopolymer transport protein ExbB
MIDYIIQGGVIMIPIVLCSVLALGIIFERLWSLRRKRIIRYDLLNRIEELLREQKIPEAITLCKRH